MEYLSFDMLVLLVLAGLGALVLIGVSVVVVLKRRKNQIRREIAQEPSGWRAAQLDGKDADSPSQWTVTKGAELVALSGPLTSQRFSIPGDGLSLGRHPDNDVELVGELMVSRHHAVIAVEQGQCILYDRDSANGTWVNDQRIFRHVLVPGDQIQIWQSQFRFDLPDAPQPTLPPSPPPSPVPISTLHAEGEYFCGYKLEGVIGRGGMSEVFKARDSQGRLVAIKILKETDPYLVSKFAQEGNEIGPLLRGHANIVYIYEFGKSPDNRLYIVMEYVEAPSLRKSMRRQWTEPEIVDVIGQVCSALAFAHQNNVVHRDIKPENILLSEDGVAKVLDFGIAKLTSASTVTRDKIVGTPEYISPEQASGEPVRPGSDVYSLGIVLYEMLAGSVPFPRPRDKNGYKAAIEVIRQHLKETPEPLRKRNPEAKVSSRLERVTMRALKKDLRHRYKTAKEMGEALGYQEKHGIRRPVTGVSEAALYVRMGPRQGQRIVLNNQGVSVGRLDLGSSDTTVSRRHASILFRGGTYWLQDTSKNGTWVDNQRVYGEVPLSNGSEIVIGDSVLRLECSSN